MGKNITGAKEKSSKAVQSNFPYPNETYDDFKERRLKEIEYKKNYPSFAISWWRLKLHFFISWFLCISGGIISLIGALITEKSIVVIGGILIAIAVLNIKAVQRQNKLLLMIVNKNKTSIEELAEAVSVKYETAIRDIGSMMREKILVGLYIDYETKTIVLNKDEGIAVETKLQEKLDNSLDIHTVVSCKNCGADGVIVKGKVSQCEYCDTYLEFK